MKCASSICGQKTDSLVSLSLLLGSEIPFVNYVNSVGNFYRVKCTFKLSQGLDNYFTMIKFKLRHLIYLGIIYIYDSGGYH